jgi:cytochrome c oxidase assembly protein subunit 15
MNKLFFRLSLAASVLALLVIVLGAYVRLSHAGLGCPDWPGCYGTLIAPSTAIDISAANDAYPHRPFEADKAWKEMIHRYFASTLGLLILGMAAIALKRRKDPQQQLSLPIILVLVVCFQGALGMWTVTLLLKPAIVTLHLLGGMLTLGLLFWATLSHKHQAENSIPVSRIIKRWAWLALIVVYCQIALGGWTSTNYVALHCYDLPTCQGQWWPATNFSEGFTIWKELGVDYEGGTLSLEAGTAVHLTHRIGALVTFLVVGSFALYLLRYARLNSNRMARHFSVFLLFALGTQLSLGLLNILLVLPTAIAVAHNGGAAILLLTLVAINRKLSIANERI